MNGYDEFSLGTTIMYFCFILFPIFSIAAAIETTKTTETTDTTSYFSSSNLTEYLRYEQEQIRLVDKLSQMTVAVFPADPDQPPGGGSAVLISPDGYALTNFHVAQPCGVTMRCGLADGKLYDTILVGIDPVGDIALIRLLGRNDFPYATFADSDTVQVGATAWVLGNPFMLATDYTPSVSRGIISGVNRYQFPSGTLLEYTDCLQTDAAVNPGNSGGPMFNENGELIGIIGRCSFEKRGRVNVGIGFAVSSNQTRHFLGHLKSGRIVDHATAGFIVSSQKNGRILIDDILETSEAFRLGIRRGDELVRFAGRYIDSPNMFQNILGIFPKEWRVPVVIRTHEGKREEFWIRLSGLHSEVKLLDMVDPTTPSSSPSPSTDSANSTEKKRGFVNYNFNRQEQNRVVSSWKKSMGTAVPTNNPWCQDVWNWQGKIAGSVADSEDTFSFEISKGDIVYDLPTDKGRWCVDTAEQAGHLNAAPDYHFIAPRGSGGLFAALSLWKIVVDDKLAAGNVAQRSDRFQTSTQQTGHSDGVPSPFPAAMKTHNSSPLTEYIGTAPIPTRGFSGFTTPLCDVLEITWDTTHSLFYFDTTDGKLLLIEHFSGPNEFPVELYITSYRKSDDEDIFLPETLEVRHGTKTFGVFEIMAAGNVAQHSDRFPTSTEQTAETGHSDGVPSPFPAVITEAMSKVVKIYGPGGLPGLSSYQSGCIISADGKILTSLSSLLESGTATVVLATGRKFTATVVTSDPYSELAILSIDDSGLPHFSWETIGAPSTAAKSIGQPVFALSNTFNIAMGNEPVSVQHGVISAVTTLKARRGMFATLYDGPVYIVDFTTNNPGSRGGALIDAVTGQLLGIIGKELRSTENHVWLNFVIPIESARTSLRTAMMKQESSPDSRQRTVGDLLVIEKEIIPEDSEKILRGWGVLLIPTVNSQTPPFVESVRPDSTAEKLGILSDDLIVLINDQLTPSRRQLERTILALPSGKPIRITLDRQGTLLEVEL